jgi:hypothetical protein
MLCYALAKDTLGSVLLDIRWVDTARVRRTMSFLEFPKGRLIVCQGSGGRSSLRCFSVFATWNSPLTWWRGKQHYSSVSVRSCGRTDRVLATCCSVIRIAVNCKTVCLWL